MTRTWFLESSVLRFSHISYQDYYIFHLLLSLIYISQKKKITLLIFIYIIWRQPDLNWHQLSCKDTIITNYTMSPIFYNSNCIEFLYFQFIHIFNISIYLHTNIPTYHHYKYIIIYLFSFIYFHLLLFFIIWI